METYIAILRGINVSGKNKIRMADLKEKLAALDFQNIRTYIQSGNVVFEYQQSAQGELKQQIEDEIFRAYGIRVPVIVLTVPELSDIVSNNPFIPGNAERDKLHVTFLSEKPEQEYLDKLGQHAGSADELIVRDKTIYLYCPNGYGRTKLTNTFFEQKLKITATTRNWKTSNKLIELAKTK